MKSKESNLKLRKLSLSIGDFIRYWGFRRIHGAIWGQMYLSNTPLSCTDLTRRLGLSKALISPALEELCEYKLIMESRGPNEKTKNYVAAENLNEVIRHVLKIREEKMLNQITSDFSDFSESVDTNLFVNQKRVKSLGEMIVTANIMLEMLMAQKDILNTPFGFEP